MNFKTLQIALVISLCAAANIAPAAEEIVELTPDTELPPLVDLNELPDFDALRVAFAKRADFERRCEVNRPAKAFMNRISKSDFTEAAAIAAEWLKNCPVDAKVHLWALAAYDDAKSKARSDLHRRWFEGLTDSALKSGNGKGPDSPIVTISIDEEYAVLTRLGLEPISQSLVLSGTKPMDAMSVKGEDGNLSTLYFYPEWHVIRLAKRVKGETR